MSIKQGNKRVMITFDEFMLEKFDEICGTLDLSYTQLFSIFAEYLYFIDTDIVTDKIDFITYLRIRFSAVGR